MAVVSWRHGRGRQPGHGRRDAASRRLSGDLLTPVKNAACDGVSDVRGGVARGCGGGCS